MSETLETSVYKLKGWAEVYYVDARTAGDFLCSAIPKSLISEIVMNSLVEGGIPDTRSRQAWVKLL